MVSPLAQAIAFQNSVNPAQSGIAPTDVVGAYKLASDVAERNYEAKLKAQMGLWGGLASLGSAGILGAKGIWAPALSKALAGGGTAAADAATPAAISGIDPATGAFGTAADALTPATGTLAADLGTTAPVGGTIAGDLAGTGAADVGGSIAADLAGTGAAGAGGAIAADLGAGTAADIGAGVAAEGGADWLMSFLPFLLA